jgi:hypothetical protein
MPPQAMQTYGLRNRRVPRSRLASCAEVACEMHIHGWRTKVTPDHDQDAAARLAYLRNDTGRHFVESEETDVFGARMIVFTFPPGQTCFREHWTEVQTLYVVRDWRGTTAMAPWRRHSGPDPWVDECATNQDALAAEEARRG